MTAQGVYVASVTPFTSSGALDLVAYQRHLNALIRAGVHGLVPCGTTGESPTIKRSERTTLLKATCELAATAGVQVMAGCGGNDTATVVDLIQEAEALGCDSTLVVTPYYNRPTASGVVAHYLHLAERATKPLYLYHVPGRTQVFLPLDAVETLFRHPRIAGIKEASGQYSYWTGLSALAKASGKTVFAGDDDAYAVLGAFGARGIISASANLVPKTYVQLFNLMESGKWSEAFELQLKLIPLVRTLFSETSPAPLKYALSQKGTMANTLRLPLVPVSEATEKSLVREMAQWEVLES
jgi:4-hydroxy-tetrahydrodipicolinate synthase